MNIFQPRHRSLWPNWTNDPAALKQPIQHSCLCVYKVFKIFWPSSHVLKDSPIDHLSLDKLFFRYDDAARSLHFLSRCPMWNSCCSLSFPWVLLLRCDDEHMDPFHQGLLTFSTLPKWLPWNRRMLWKTRGRVRERDMGTFSLTQSNYAAWSLSTLKMCVRTCSHSHHYSRETEDWVEWCWKDTIK